MRKKQLTESLQAKNQQVQTLLNAHPDELPAEVKSELVTLENEMAGIENELAELAKDDDYRQKAADRNGRLNDPANRPAFDNTGATAKQLTDDISRGLGTKFTQSPEYKAWLKQIAPNGRIPERTPLNSPAIPFEGLEKGLKQKTLVTAGSNTSAGALVTDVRLPLVNEGLFRPLTVRDLLTIIPVTNGDTIEYPRMNTFTNNAAPVPEANVTTFTGAVGQVEGRKPESGLALEIITDHVRTIAHWIPTTTKALLDAAQIESLINTFLLYGLKEKSENMVVNGDGTGDQFLGILNTPNTQAQPFDTDMLRTLRKARTKVKSPGRVDPTAYLMNPADWEEIDLMRDNEQRYYFGGPTAIGNPRVWGLPVIESEAVPQGIAICAAWRFAVLYDRMQGSISASNSHADFFVRNMVALLAECMEGFGIHYTKAFVEIDLTAV